METDPCDGCYSNHHVCLVKYNDIDPKGCPCMHCIIKMMCNSCCDDYYELRLEGKTNND